MGSDQLHRDRIVSSHMWKRDRAPVGLGRTKRMRAPLHNYVTLRNVGISRAGAPLAFLLTDVLQSKWHEASRRTSSAGPCLNARPRLPQAIIPISRAHVPNMAKAAWPRNDWAMHCRSHDATALLLESMHSNSCQKAPGAGP